MAANGVSGPHGTDRAGAPDAGPVHVELGHVGFEEVLRAVNPLQYLPVVGTIYRVVTGDAAPSGLRQAVSAVAGVLTGGPVGLIGSILGSLAENFLHVEGRLREAVVPSRPAALAAAAPAATHADAESDLGRRPAAAAPGQAAMAYRAAGLLGAV